MNNKNKDNIKISFWIFSILGIILGTGCGIFYILYFLGRGLQTWIDEKIGSPSDPTFIIFTTLLIASQFILFIFSYLLSFNKEQKERPGRILYFALLGVSLHLGGFSMGFFGESNPKENPLIAVCSIGIILFFPLTIFLFEWILKNSFIYAGSLMFKMEMRRVALMLLTKALSFAPQRFDLEEKRAQLLFELGKDEEGEKIYDEIKEKGILSSALLKIALTSFLKRISYEKAIECSKKLIEIYKDDLNLKKILADCFIQNHQIEEAIGIYEEIGDFSNTDFLLKMMNLYLELNRINDALNMCKNLAKVEGKPYRNSLKALNNLLQKYPDNLEILKEIVNIETIINDLDSISSHLEQILELSPQDAEAREKIISTYKNTFQYGNLSRHLEWLLNNGKENSDILCDYGETLIHLKEDEKAFEILKKGNELYPGDYRFPYQLSYLFLNENKYLEAMSEVTRALALAPQEKRNGLTILKNKISNEYDEKQIEELQKAVEKNPEDFGKRTLLIEKLVENSLLEKAATEVDDFISLFSEQKKRMMEFLEELLKKTEKNYFILNYLADLHFKEGNFDRMLEMYNELSKQSVNPDLLLKDACLKIIEVSPNYSPAHKILVEIAEKEGKIEDVAQHMETIMKIEGVQDYNLIQKLFDLYYGLGNTEKAYELCLLLLDKDPENLANQKKMILLSKELGKIDISLERVTKFRKVYPDDLELKELENEVDLAIKRKRMEEIRGILKERGDDPALHEEYGDLAFFFDNLNEAILHYQKALKWNVNSSFPKAKLALCLAQKKMFELADETLNEIKLSITPDMAPSDFQRLLNLYYATASLFELDGNREFALKFYKRIFRVDAGFKDVVEKIERLS